ncbi:hypothetical protein AQUCO_07200032v1 [Aquilegia coerulea]|uniref:KIB1-4 beta-propeller domain-containing protein n=1 Tax=Aquilegia coerulea TaxID=218851 RepID=A0A2G5CA12_AQUCA|nr:hypothetical protein AQUCO_07200032v1 [Aquilegia coerulea]
MLTPNWSELPEELLRIIAEKIIFSHDFIRFGAVCHQWRSVTLTFDKGPRTRTRQTFFIPFENRICHINLPEARGCHCWGSPYGWLITFGFDQQFHLLNPLTRVRLPLPPQSTFQDSLFTDTTPGVNRMCCVSKAFIVSTSDDNVVVHVDDLLVLLTIGQYGNFVFARPGDKSWSVIQITGRGNVRDFIHFNGQFYGVDELGNLKVCDFSGPRPVFFDFANHPEYARGCEGYYLVELGGDLHMVIRFYDPTPVEIPPKEFQHFYKSVFFDILKFDFCTCKWETLGDHAIFIGSNTTFGFKASDYPACKPDCIYFTDDYDNYLPLYEGNDIVSRFSPPVWIAPNPF